MAFGKEDVLSVSGEYGVINQIAFQGRSFAGESVADYHVVETDDIVYTKSPLKANPYGIIKVNKGIPGIVSTLYAVYHPLNTVAPRFVDLYFANDLRLNKFLKPLVNIGAKHDMKVNNSFVLTGTVVFPSIGEQQKLVDFFAKLDRRIEAQRKIVDTLKKYKRGLIKALLSGTVTFSGGDCESWETVSLADIFTISAGGDIDRQNSSPTYSPSYPYPVYANALTNKGLYGYANYFKVKGDSITVSGRGEVGHAIARHCKYVPIVRLLSLVPKYDDDVDFFAYMINATSIYIESTGVPQLTSPQLGAIKVLRPPISEQKRLSSLLLKIDAKIENAERLTLYLDKIRASMLQQLFI